MGFSTNYNIKAALGNFRLTKDKRRLTYISRSSGREKT